MNINVTLIGQMIMFFMFVFFCMKYVWPPIVGALAEREQKIAEGLAAGEKGRHDLELAEQRATELLREGKEKAQEFIANAEKRATELVEESKLNAKAEGDRMIAAARVQIEQERNQAREALREQVAALAITGAEQILAREVDVNAHHELLQRLSAEI
ncbi:MAG: F0F1 ATP synthase subunit B [Gammaproteobacteria bacterium]|nr:F0F1 ATP synthase subunit B [Gammaproteobacteria bacterium]